MELLSDPAPEGSTIRKRAREWLLSRAKAACDYGRSFEEWRSSEDAGLLEKVTEKDLDAIFGLIWEVRFSSRRRKYRG